MKTIQLSEAVKSKIAKWNETSSISTALGIDNNGNNSRINPVNLLKAQRRRYIPSTGFNDAVGEGAYTISDSSNSLPNAPSDVSYGVLCVANTTDFVVQYVFELFGKHRFFYRTCNEKGIWGPWVSFTPTA